MGSSHIGNDTTFAGFSNPQGLENTILAAAPLTCNCVGGATDDDHPGDFCGTSVIPTRLGPLADSGGQTQMHALLSGTPAINTSANVGCPATDQRGFPRAGTWDIGAFEVAFTVYLSLVLR